MRLATNPRRLKRAALIGLFAALLVVGIGLLRAGWQPLSLGPSATEVSRLKAVSLSAVSSRSSIILPTVVLDRPTTEPLLIPDVEPVIRPPGRLVSQGDLAGVGRLFDLEHAMTFVADLSSPAFGGKEPGTPGGTAAGEYIAEKYEEFGLRPAGTDGYFQTFSVPYAEVTASPTLIITSATGTMYNDLTFREDFAFAWGGYAGGGVADGRIFWVNEGLHRDYRGLDVTGQIVFCEFSREEEVLRQAVEHGASGLLLLTEDERRIDTRRTYREPPYLPQSLPVLLVSRKVAAALLEGSGYSVRDVSILYQSVPLPTTAHFEIPMYEPGGAVARNVLGVLPGSDPGLREQVIVIGAHYDHLGTDPNGDIYAGANDDASGVAVLLEIARTWQMAGFVPDSTVLFAAWDGEEQGLLGSSYYVRHPRYPLTDTIGMIQLDMVGLATEGVMMVDGYANSVGRQLRTSARLIDVPTRESDLQGRSDHGPFLKARVPATLLTWDDTAIPYYHTTRDIADTLQPERLRQAGFIASHTALALAAVVPRLQALLAAQTEAVRAGDTGAYLATLDPADETLIRTATGWLASRPAKGRRSFSLSASAFEIGEDVAQANVTADTVDAQGQNRVSTSYLVRFVRRGAAWYTTWPGAGVITTTSTIVRIVKPGRDDVEWARFLDDTFSRVSLTLGHVEGRPLVVTAYPDRDTLDWLAGEAGGELGSPVRVAHIVRTRMLTPTVVSLVLEQMGLPLDQGDWLRVGLSDWVETSSDPKALDAHLLMLDVSDTTSPALSVMRRRGSTFNSTDVAVTRSLVGHLMDQYGPDGLRQLCVAWGEGSQEAAFAALGITPQAYARSWGAAVVDPMMAAQGGIRRTLEQRESAVMAGDKEAFLGTVTPDDPIFLAEEAHWFNELTEYPLEAYDLAAEILSLEGDGALARLRTIAKLADAEREIRTTHAARFYRRGEHWVLAGADWKAIERDHLIVRYTDATTETVLAVLDAAERSHQRVTTDLQYAPASRTEIKLYDNLQVTTLHPLPSWVQDRHSPGGSIQLSARALDIGRLTAQGFTRMALSDLGVDLDWFSEGVAMYESLRVMPERTASLKLRYVPVVRDAQRRHQLLDWADMPEADDIDEKQERLFYGQSWMLVDELVRQRGLAALNRLIRSIGMGRSFQDAFLEATGMSFTEWAPVWEQTVRTGSVPVDQIQMAQAFDPEQALSTVRHLASAEYAGRRAGSPEAERAAHWIAEQMRICGLQPGASDGTFFQAIPVPYTELTAMPMLDLRSVNTGKSLSLTYLAAFREVLGGDAGGGYADADVVWLPNGYEEGLRPNPHDPGLQAPPRIVPVRADNQSGDIHHRSSLWQLARRSPRLGYSARAGNRE